MIGNGKVFALSFLEGVDMDKELTRVFIIKPKDKFDSATYERLAAYCEHLGILVGGGWSSNYGATLFMDPHTSKCRCETALPHIEEINDELIDLIRNWCDNNDLIIESIMTEDEHERYELDLMQKEMENEQ